MAAVVHIADRVVTGDTLARQHQGEEEVCVSPGTVVTPTGWDYIRQHRLSLVRGEPESAAQGPPAPAADGGFSPPIAEVRPLSPDEMRLVQEGRCDHPDRPFGCTTEEFGSGFAEPASCCECGVGGESGEPGAAEACDCCSRKGAAAAANDQGRDGELEALVQYITDEIMARLEG